MTLMEIFDYIEAKREKEKEERLHKAKQDYVLAQIIAEHIASVFSKDAKPRMLWEVYPGQFEKDRAHFEEEEEKRIMQEMRAARMARVEYINQMRLLQKMEGEEQNG